MKINWGTGIVIAILLFMSFILYFVVKVQTNSKYDNELVVEEYYKKDSHYQDEIKEMENVSALIEKPVVTKSVEGVKIVFPASFEPQKIKGKVSFYRPSNKKLDFEVPISISQSYLLIPNSSLVGGLWGISIEWKYDGKDYLIKDKLYL